MGPRLAARNSRLLALIAACLLLPAALAADPQPLAFHLRFDKSARDKPFTGRVYVMLTKQETKELPSGVNYFKPEPIFARDVKEWKPGEILVVGADSLGFPHKLAELPKETYSMHAVMDFDQADRHFSTAAG